MNIRNMQAKDKEQVLAMMQVFYHSPATLVRASIEVLEQSIADCISDMPFVEGYVFEDGQMLLGYAMISKSYSTEYGGVCLWLEDLYLEPHARGKGIGTKFFQFITEAYKDLAVRLRLEVTADNTRAIKAYENQGFARVGYISMSKMF